MPTDFRKILLDLNPRVKGRPNIRILGVFHAVSIPDLSDAQLLSKAIAGTIHRPKKDEEHLQAVMAKHVGKLLTEGSKVSHSGLFVPPQFLARARPLENPVIDQLRELAVKNMRLGLQDTLLQHMHNSFVMRNHSVKLVKKPLPRRQERENNRNFAGEKRKTPEFRFTTNVRSALMAAELLKESRLDNQDIIAVVGLFHANQMHRFIRNPKHAIAYLASIKTTLETAAKEATSTTRAKRTWLSDDEVDLREEASQALKHTPLSEILGNAINEFRLLLKPSEERELIEKKYLKRTKPFLKPPSRVRL